MKLHTLTASFLITTIVINANTEDALQPTAVQSVRNILGTYDTEIHTKDSCLPSRLTRSRPCDQPKPAAYARVNHKDITMVQILVSSDSLHPIAFNPNFKIGFLQSVQCLCLGSL